MKRYCIPFMLLGITQTEAVFHDENGLYDLDLTPYKDLPKCEAAFRHLMFHSEKSWFLNRAICRQHIKKHEDISVLNIYMREGYKCDYRIVYEYILNMAKRFNSEHYCFKNNLEDIKNFLDSKRPFMVLMPYFVIYYEKSIKNGENGLDSDIENLNQMIGVMKKFEFLFSECVKEYKQNEVYNFVKKEFKQ